MKILFVLPSLELGGAERVFSFLSGKLDPSKFNVKLLVIGYKENAMFFFDPGKTIFLNKSRVLAGVTGVVATIRDFKPDMVIGTIVHLNILMGILSFFFPKTMFFGRETSVYSHMKRYAEKKPPLADLLIKFFYPRLSGIICQSLDMKEDLHRGIGLPDDKLKVINNPITHFPNKIRSRDNAEPIKFITVGRLTPEKGHSRILAVLSRIGYNFEYLIIGKGPNKDAIVQQVSDLNLSAQVKYVPHTKDVGGYLEESDFFLQGSHVEGFPNAVLESCTFGVPVIAFDVPGGTKEIIENGRNGFLVNSEIEMCDLLTNVPKLQDLKREQVSAFTIARFHPDKIVKEYEDYFFKSFQHTHKIL